MKSPGHLSGRNVERCFIFIFVNWIWTGNLILRTNAFQVKNEDNDETLLQANEDGAVTLYYKLCNLGSDNKYK